MHYSKEHEQDMRNLYNSLSEKDRRRYAAVEAIKLGHGGIKYICSLFGCDDKTVRKGVFELQNEESLKQDGVRKPGGGRKKLDEEIPDINQAWIQLVSATLTVGKRASCGSIVALRTDQSKRSTDERLQAAYPGTTISD